MTRFPQLLTPTGHVEPVPRRIRAVLDGVTVVDTTEALYVWEWPGYPQFYVPDAAVHASARSAVEAWHDDHVKLRWDAMDAWFEEDEQVFVHPRSPYVRVDALRSSRPVRVELGGVVLAESSAPVLVFETGLPTRTYVDRSAVHWEQLTPSSTTTSCPYKGRTSAYWSVADEPDLAWSYDFPTAALLPIAGLVAFYDEKVDVFVAGVQQERPVTHFG